MNPKWTRKVIRSEELGKEVVARVVVEEQIPLPENTHKKKNGIMFFILQKNGEKKSLKVP